MKEILRSRFRKMLAVQDSRTRKKRSLRIQEKLFELEVFKKSLWVCFYAALSTEVNTLPMIRRALLAGKRVVVPRANGGEMSLCLYEIQDPKTDLKKGSFGILEPQDNPNKRINPGKLDVVIVPGLAFDQKNYRLGRGKGFYDRFLVQLMPRVQKIGLAFSFQMLPKLPHERHDVRLDLVLTD